MKSASVLSEVASRWRGASSSSRTSSFSIRISSAYVAKMSGRYFRPACGRRRLRLVCGDARRPTENHSASPAPMRFLGPKSDESSAAFPFHNFLDAKHLNIA